MDASDVSENTESLRKSKREKKLRTERKNTHSVTKGHLATSNRLSVTVKGKKNKELHVQ